MFFYQPTAFFISLMKIFSLLFTFVKYVWKILQIFLPSRIVWYFSVAIMLLTPGLSFSVKKTFYFSAIFCFSFIFNIKSTHIELL